MTTTGSESVTTEPKDIMKPYTSLLAKVISEGEERQDRTGTGTFSLFGEQIRFNLAEGFPILTQRRLHWKSIVGELAWFLSGSTDVRDLQALGVTIWDEWATAEQCAKFGRKAGDLGPVYGRQWRNFGDRLDQIHLAAETLRENPYSRRNIVSAWNPLEAGDVTLPPCHTLFQLYVSGERRVSLHLYQRSADMFLGVPFNIASYALLLHLFAKVSGLKAWDLVISFGDVHVYHNHLAQCAELLRRPHHEAPVLTLSSQCNLSNLRVEWATLDRYEAGAPIKAEVAV